MPPVLSANDDFNGDAIELPPTANTADIIIGLLVQELENRGAIPAGATEEIVRDVILREGLGSTAIGRAVAVPHAQSDLVTAPQFVVGRCATAIDWPGALDRLPVSTICLFIAPKSTEMVLKSLEMAANLLRK